MGTTVYKFLHWNNGWPITNARIPAERCPLCQSSVVVEFSRGTYDFNGQWGPYMICCICACPYNDATGRFEAYDQKSYDFFFKEFERSYGSNVVAGAQVTASTTWQKLGSTSEAQHATIVPTAKHKCHCEISVLTSTGCKCGGI